MPKTAMAASNVLVPASLSAGYHANEILAIVGPDHSALVDVSQVRPSRPVKNGKVIAGQVLAFMIEQGPQDSLVELPGVAVGALRGRVPNARIKPLT